MLQENRSSRIKARRPIQYGPYFDSPKTLLNRFEDGIIGELFSNRLKSIEILWNLLKSVEIFSVTKNKLPKWVVQWTLIETVVEDTQKMRWNCIDAIECSTRFVSWWVILSQNGRIFMSRWIHKSEGYLKWTWVSVRWVLTFLTQWDHTGSSWDRLICKMTHNIIEIRLGVASSNTNRVFKSSFRRVQCWIWGVANYNVLCHSFQVCTTRWSDNRKGDLCFV